jgi:uncharacterized OsmC-like protein
MSGSEETPLGRTAHFEKTHDSHTTGTVRGHEVESDEPEPIGNNAHPSPVDYLVTSLSTCQMTVLSLCLEKARVDDYEMSVDVQSVEQLQGSVAEEMPDGTRKRVERVDLELTLTVPEAHADRAGRCLEVYDTGCVVGQSIGDCVDYETETELVVRG